MSPNAYIIEYFSFLQESIVLGAASKTIDF